MVSRLYAILDPQASGGAGGGGGPSRGKGAGGGAGGDTGGRASGSKISTGGGGSRQRQQQQAEYLERRDYRARLLQGVRAAREAEVRRGNETLRRQRAAVGALVPGREALQEVRGEE